MPFLGDHIERALSSVGITEERVSALIGGDCGCKGRKDRLNVLDAWARRVLAGKKEKAREYLDKILSG